MRARRRAMTTVLSIVVAVALGVPVPGCTRRTVEPARPAATATAAPAGLELMTQNEKMARIAPSFPPQVPVPAGHVVRGQAQGPGAWDYQIIVNGDVASVGQWYRAAYQRAEWTVLSDTGSSLSFEKNSAQSRIVLSATQSGAPPMTLVTATLGVGTPVLQTQ